MPNYQLPNDVVRTFPGAIGNATRNGVPVPNPGAVYTAVSSDELLLHATVVNNSDLVVNATGVNTVGLTVTISETGGLPENAFVWTIDTVDDVTPDHVSFNPAVIVVDVAQPVPVAPVVVPAGP